MLSSNRLILETIAVLRAHGVVDYVLCPGSRNAGIVHTICEAEDFCHMATDERSAGFMAIGMALSSNLPTAVIVTSGSALANLYPAACEAYYQHVPVVFISADRPAAWIGQMDGQTMPQHGALGNMVKMSVTLPELCSNAPNDFTTLWHANRLLNEAMIACHERSPQGPVHINIPISEPIYKFTEEHLPLARGIHLCRDLRRLTATYSSTLIIIGQMSKNEASACNLIEEVAHRYSIVAENLSNIPPQFYTNASRIDWNRMEPVDRVITMGGHIINKDLKQFFRTHRPKEHWHVSTDGAVADLFCCQTLAVQSSASEFMQELLSKRDEHLHPIRLPLAQAKDADHRTAVIAEFFSLLPKNAAVHLANSSTVRLAQTAMELALEKDGFTVPTILCNRGINGIEGSLSSAVGYAKIFPDEEVYIIIGDLSFFYDQNALWTTPLPQNLHILLFNDGHGSIFNTLPVPREPETSRKAIMGEHNLSAKHVAQLHNVKYLEGEENLQEFINSEEITILEINI